MTVFVRRIGGQFHANTHAADAISPKSATCAARACAARHFGVTEDRIALDPDSQQVLIASVMEPTKGDLRVLSFAAGAALVAVVVLWTLFRGGAR